ncbi:MAG: hypothetical protein IJ243_09080 [Prevotella sp.]|nr:hypothetical protein [Prevotella sp.]
MITGPVLSSPLFTSDIPSLELRLEPGAAGARITITCHDTTVIDQYYYADTDGVIALYDIDRLLADELRLARRSNLLIEATADDGEQWASGLVDVIYCLADTGTTCQAFIDSHFLTTLDGPKMTAVGRTELLSATGAASDTATVKARYLTPGGLVVEREVELLPQSENNGIYKYAVCPADYTNDSLGGLCAIDVSCGERSQHFDVDPLQPDCAPVLLFINSFGCEELLYCTGEHQADPSYDRHTARIDMRRRNYSIIERRIFKADTGILTTAMASWADELLRSDEVYLWTDGRPGREVVITESKSERSSLADEQPRFTFSYEYSQRIHNVMQPGREGRIFDNTFDSTFN